mmetsp:Transcript_30546/g.50579  ORF Transcript_30546/g.50579 Transcript_30546/m.50579 type:complete len:261 (-) Transcript_30546:446-1228(-)
MWGCTSPAKHKTQRGSPASYSASCAHLDHAPCPHMCWLVLRDLHEDHRNVDELHLSRLRAGGKIGAQMAREVLRGKVGDAKAHCNTGGDAIVTHLLRSHHAKAGVLEGGGRAIRRVPPVVAGDAVVALQKGRGEEDEAARPEQCVQRRGRAKGLRQVLEDLHTDDHVQLASKSGLMLGLDGLGQIAHNRTVHMLLCRLLEAQQVRVKAVDPRVLLLTARDRFDVEELVPFEAGRAMRHQPAVIANKFGRGDACHVVLVNV